MRKMLLLFTVFAGVLLMSILLFGNPAIAFQKNQNKLMRILLITGGCCHNYTFQTQALKDGVAAMIKAEWTVVNEGGKGTQAMIPLYDNPDWAKGYDVVIHNECFADTKTPEYIQKITKTHYAGVPAVVIHCAMHTYRGTDINDWREFLGVTTRRHDHQSNYPVTKVDKSHAILKSLPDNWKTPKDELYIIEKAWPGTRVLATSVSEKDGKTYPVIWTNQYGKARVFGTTFGHSDDTFKDKIFIDIVARGVIWASGRVGTRM